MRYNSNDEGRNDISTKGSKVEMSIAEMFKRRNDYWWNIQISE